MDLDLIKKTTEDLLTEIGFFAKVEVIESEGSATVSIDVGEENAMLIGFHGETLNGLQTVVSLILYKRLGVYTPVVMDVGGYREERAEKIRQMAVNAADRARFLVKPVELLPMNPSERRLAHMFVGQLPGVKSESVGEGSSRHVVVSPATTEEKV
jgi:spoIIIJ-associated protein